MPAGLIHFTASVQQLLVMAAAGFGLSWVVDEGLGAVQHLVAPASVLTPIAEVKAGTTMADLRAQRIDREAQRLQEKAERRAERAEIRLERLQAETQRKTERARVKQEVDPALIAQLQAGEITGVALRGLMSSGKLRVGSV